MRTANDRIEFLKWVNINFKKVQRMQAKLSDLADEVGRYPDLQDLNLCTATSSLFNLEDRLEYLNATLDSAHYINTGELKPKERIE